MKKLIYILFFSAMITQTSFAQKNELLDIEQIILSSLNYNYYLSPRSDTHCLYHITKEDLLWNLIDSTKEIEILHADTIYVNINENRTQKILGPDTIVSTTRKGELTQKDIESILESKRKATVINWEKSILDRFDQKNKQTGYNVSTPLFNADYTKAIVIVQYWCKGFLCGNGDIYLLQKENNTWKQRSLSHWDN